MEFADLGLCESSLKVINELGYEIPTSIQESAIPRLLETKDDFVGQAQTGTGKTAAFVFPLIERIDTNSKRIQVLILAPTRELANQVCEEFDKLSKYSPVKTQAVFGGMSYDRQINGIKKNRPQVIVGTPGRVMDLMRKGILDFKKTEYLILDEADEMLNMGFFEDVKEIIEQFNQKKMMWMFSATMPTQIKKLIKENFNNPFFVTVEREDISNSDIEQHYYIVKSKYHKDALCRIIDFNPDMYAIVFCRTRIDTKELADDLLFNGYSVESLHGDMGQYERDMAMKHFKSGRARLMICTDVAARGIDVNNLTHVINYGLPQDSESYVHRIGRTGRAGLKGIAITLVDPKAEYRFKRIEKFTGKKIALKKLPTVQQMKEALIVRELEGLEGVVSAVAEKQDEFKLDKSYRLFKEALSELDKEDMLKVMFTMKFNKPLRRLDEIGDLNHADTRKSRSKSSRGQFVADSGNVRLFLNMGIGDGLNIRNLLDDLSKQTGLKRRDIQNVELKPRFSFLEVPQKYSRKVLTHKNLKINNRNVRFECSKART